MRVSIPANRASMASMRLSNESKCSPMKVWSPSSLSRMLCIRDEESSLWGGGEGERSSAACTGASFFTQEPPLSLRYPKEETTFALIEKDLLTLTKGSESRGTLKRCRNKVIRWGYGSGAFDRNALCMRYLTRWAQSIWQPVKKTTLNTAEKRSNKIFWFQTAKQIE